MGIPILKHAGRFLNYFATESGWEFVSRKKEPWGEDKGQPDAVIIIPIIIDENGLVQVILTHEWREPIQDYSVGFPAGIIDEGETVEETAIRELKEETGLSVYDILHTSKPMLSTEGLTDEVVSVVYVLCDGELSDKYLKDSEDINTQIINRNDAIRLLNPTNDALDSVVGKIAYFVLQDFANTSFHWMLRQKED